MERNGCSGRGFSQYNDLDNSNFEQQVVGDTEIQGQNLL